MLNLDSSMILWITKKQEYIALSSVEVEYIAITSTTCQTIWFQRILIDL